MRAARAVGVAGGINQRAAERLGRNQNLERNSLRGDDRRRTPGDAAVEGAIESNVVGLAEIVPGGVGFAVGADEKHGANGSPRTGWAVNALHGERRAVVCGAREANSSAAGTA